MKFQNAKICVFSIMMVLCLFGCAEDFLFSDEAVNTFSTIDALTDKCTEETNGVMVFVKKEATMYVCTDNEWVAMQNKNHKCHSEDLVDGDGIAIVCDGETIGVVNNGKDADMDAIQEQIEDKGCQVVDTTRNYEEAVIKVTIRCGDAQTEMKIPFTEENKNLANVYKKHVVVRFPVQTTKETNSQETFEELWKNFKSGENAELTVMELDENLNATGKMFLKDLFASDDKSFVTIEESNKKTVEYKIARLEGDLDITNLTSSIVQLRTNLILKQSKAAKGKRFTNIIYNAYADFSETSDTIVIDFLTDYKAARVKNLVDEGLGKTDFATANKKANQELADALYLEHEGVDDYPAFEHFVPNEVGLAEYFNSIVWVMALIDQKDKTPGFNSIYNAFRNVFAENGNFNTAVNTTYAGKEHSMFFVDYLALLIDANFFKWNQMQHGDNTTETNVWSGTDAVYYKILQNGFVDAYKLDASKTKVFKDGDYSSKVLKSTVEGGYFHYFEYIENDQVWYPVALWAAGAATVEKVCDADAVNSTFFYSFEGLDDNAVCVCNNGECYWKDPKNVCLGRNKGDKGSAFIDGEIQEYECECNLSASFTCDDLVPSIPSSSSSVASSSSAASGKTPEELANNPESKVYLGECSATVNVGKEKLFDYKNAELATTTSKITFVCDGSQWRVKNELDEKYGTCTKTVMGKGVVKEEAGSAYYKCDYLDKQEKYEWIATDWQEAYIIKKACHYGYVNEKLVTESGYEYVCEENSEYTDNWGNHSHEWRETTVDEYCVGDRVEATVQKVEDEDLGESTFNEKCSYHGSTYARNNTASGAKEWVYYGNFTNESTRNSVLLLLNGYKDNIIYTCNDWVNIYCEPDSVETVQSKIASNMPENEKQKWINVLCNYGDYKRASGYADGIAFEVNVTLKSGETPKTFVASAKRNDWHEPTFEDIYGKCDEDKMKNQTKVAVYGGEKYKCNYISGVSSSGYSWVKASDLDENATLGICTSNRKNKKDVAIVGDAYYECLDNGNVEGIPESSSSTDWKEIGENEYLNVKLGNCDTDEGDTKIIEDIKSETLKDGDSHSFKCSIAKGVEYGEGKWVDASTDIALNQICYSDNENATVTKESVIYVCAYKDESSMYQWITFDE